MHGNVLRQLDTPATHERLDCTVYQRSVTSTVEWTFVASGIFF